MDNHGKYLGAPSLIGRNRKEVFEFLKEKTWKRISGWRGKFLSKAGKEVLLKAVVQVVPSYIMGVFLIPKSTCEDLEKMMNSFWWGNSVNPKEGIKWKRWDHMCDYKGRGGLGFRKIHEFNVAMLGKQAWRLISHPNSLVSRIYKARYYASSSFFEANLGSNPSYCWRSLLAAKELLLKGSVMQVGNGVSIKIWQDPWLPNADRKWVGSGPPEHSADDTVSNLLIPGYKIWDYDLISETFEEEDMKAIMSIPLTNSVAEDRWMWIPTKDGLYSVKSGYHMLTAGLVNSTGPCAVDWSKLWKLDIPFHIRNFLWRLFTNCLPTRTEIRRRNIDIDILCPVCGIEGEDAMHVFLRCPLASTVLAEAGFGSAALSISAWWQGIVTLNDDKKLKYAAVILWTIWCARNDKVFNNKDSSVPTICLKATAMLDQWSQAQAVTPVHSAVESTHRGSNRSASISQWKKPPNGWMSCCFDSSVNPDATEWQFGCVIRSHLGSFIAGLHGKRRGYFSPALVEALGFKEVLSWVKQLGYENIVFEGDCQELMKGVATDKNDRSYFGAVVQDCRQLLGSFGRYVCRWISRSANRIADSIAKYSDSMSDHVEWRDVPPLFICNMLYED